MRNLFLPFASLALTLACSCQNDDAIPVPTDFRMDNTWLTLGVGDSQTLTVAIEPEGIDPQHIVWESDKLDVVTVEAGRVTALAEGSATIKASIGQVEATCTVHVSWLGKVAFRTEKTWTIGEQVWSDAVMAARCKKEEFDGGTYGDPVYKVDCRQNEGYGDWFSWAAVDTYKTILCPEGWRVPTKEDFYNLDIALGGDGENHMMDSTPEPYIDEWEGQYGGYCWWYQDALQLTEVGTYAAYWSQTPASEGQSYALNFGGHYGFRTPQAQCDKYNGFALRCVKDV